jgi:ubiquinone/menaquinone biosynthesis C-methylase UbiE
MESIKHAFDFEPFADTPEYLRVNSEIVRSWVELIVERGMDGVDSLLDIATGAGTMVELFIEQLPAHWNPPVVRCLDQSMEALCSVQERLAKRVVKLLLIHSPAEEMAMPESSIDIAVWGNGIHYLSEEAQKRSVIRIKQALKPGGLFFFNTSFYDGARPLDTLAFYRAQVKKAVEFLRAAGIQRIQTESRPEASKFLSKSYYEQLVVDASFKLEEVKEVSVDLYRRAWEHISSFHQYAAGALHGYPPEEASIAMKNAVSPVLEQYGKKDELGIPYIPRNWLAISASS